MCCHEVSRNMSRPVMCLMSDTTTLARNKSQQNITQQSESTKLLENLLLATVWVLWPRRAHTHTAVKIFSTMWSDKLCLIFPRKSLAAVVRRWVHFTYLEQSPQLNLLKCQFSKSYWYELMWGQWTLSSPQSIWNMILINCSWIISTCATLISLQTQCNIFKVPT